MSPGKPTNKMSNFTIPETPEQFQKKITELQRIISQQESELATYKQENSMLRDREERLTLTIEGAGLGFWDHDFKTNEVIRNELWASMLGYTLEEVNANVISWKDMTHPDDRPNVKEACRQNQLGNTPFFRVEHRLKMKNGEWKWILNCGMVVERDDDGKPIRATGTHVDISKLKQVEEALQDEKSKLQSVVDAVGCGLTIQDKDFNVIFQNRISREYYPGLGRKCYKAFEGRDEICEGCPVKAAYDDGQSHTVERETHLPSGELAFWENTANPIRNAQGKIIACLEITRNITEQKQAEEQLRLNEERLDLALSGANEGVWDWHLDDNKVLFDSRYYTIAGYEPDEFPSTYEEWEKRVHPDDKQHVQLAIEEYLTGQSDAYKSEFRFLRKSGDYMWIRGIGKIFTRDKLGNPLRFTGTHCDITEQKLAAEEMVRQQQTITLNNRIANVFLTPPEEEIYTDVLNVILKGLNSRFGLFGYIDEDGNLVCPSMTRDVWAMCQLADKSLVFARDSWDGLWGRSLVEKRTLVANEGLRFPDGHLSLENALVTPILHHDTLIGLFIVANKSGGYNGHDKELLENAAAQTAPVLYALLEEARQKKEHEKLEVQLRQAQRMEAVGQLAGGVAHDFNNLLQVINGYAEIVLCNLDVEHSCHTHVGEIARAGSRAASLVRQLLAFSRRQVLEMRDINLNDVITDLMKMIRRVIGEHIVLDFHANCDLGIVRADPGQVEQVLLNLCVNARDAMPDGGKITIETENARVDEEFCKKHPWADPGLYALMSVSDTGCGMDDETMANIFEPFFTTKDVGKGTGLGLSTVYGLVKQHRGLVHVYSEIDKGSIFRVYLPLIECVAEEIGERPKSPAVGGTETILLAEDDDMVRNLSQSILEEAGYKVLTAVDGKDALRKFMEQADQINLVLLDLVMPNMGGHTVFKEIHEIYPDTKVLFSSGYSLNAIHSDFVLDEGMELIRKPFRRDDLLSKIREALDSNEAPLDENKNKA
jgi:PAS domain S-box-containing protein